MTGLHRKLLGDLKTMGWQVFTIALLIVGGVSVLVSSWSSYESLRRARDHFYNSYRFADIFTEVVRAPETLLHSVQAIPGVSSVEMRIVKEGLVAVPGQAEPALGRFISMTGENQKLNLLYLRQGRLPQAGPQVEVVVHESFAKAHNFKTGQRFSALIAGVKREFVIAGVGLSPEYVYALNPAAPLPDDKHFGIFWARHQDLQALTGLQNAFNNMVIGIDRQASVGVVLQQIENLLEPYGHISTYERARQISDIFVEGEINEQRVMAIVMPSIFMAVAMFILNIILSRLIATHRMQIATLKSLGYSGLALSFHYFQLITAILIVGLLPAYGFGSWIGHWYAGLYAEYFHFPVIDFSLSFRSLWIGAVAGLVPGWIATFTALFQVYRLRPAEALRPPEPPEFHIGFIEKIATMGRQSLYTKMLWRSLLMHPMRLILSVLGMAAAIAILVNGSFWMDVIDFMIQRQFHEMHREDLTVNFLNPRSKHVIAEIRQLPGVLMVEGERSEAVRLIYKSMKKEVALLGVDASAQLTRVLDSRGRRIVPQRDGVLLSRYFETKMGVQIGERITFKVLQGKQQTLQASVLGFVDDMVGQQIYAHVDDMHAWLNEEEVYSSAKILVDARSAQALYIALKEKPEVSAVNVRSLLLKSFIDTVAEMILTFTFILYIFALAIAVAVMYNSARITLNERGWELASLRILGVEVRPTFELMFFDVGLRMLLALIPGLLLGYWLSDLSTRMIHNETFSFPLVIEPSTYAGAIFMLILTFLATGIFLYRKVIQVDFSEALKARV